MLSSRLQEYRSSPQCYRWGLLSVVVIVFVWTQAINHFTRHYENTADVRKVSTSSHYDYENATNNNSNASDTLVVEPLVVQQNQSQSTPQVIWLMSFPNSGTTYTNKLVQGISQTTTATNYGAEQSGRKTSIPMSPDLPDGPFLRWPDWNYSKYILTKTHCGGYCIKCSPRRYVLNAAQFEAECRTGNKRVNRTEITTPQAYPASLPKKAVHVIRNPFDNLVARLHHQRKTWEKENTTKSEHLKLFQSTEEGFRKWCSFVDYSSAPTHISDLKVFDNTTMDLFEQAPCASDVYRWTQFHNLALEVTKDRLHIPVQTIHYEAYANRFEETVHDLLEFLELPSVSEAPPFIRGKEYPDYFSDEDRYHVAKLVQHLSTNKTWPFLKHYFDGLLEDDDDTRTTSN